jgi:hypothetical protein
MRTIRLALAITVVATAGANLTASDRVGVYGVIDKVVFEPNAENPDRVQLWGAFAIATRTDRDYYQPVQTGYLYYKLPEDARLARAEWRDLNALAGTKKIAAFATRLGQSVRMRAASETPQTPDTYALGIGVQTIRADRDYAPIKAIATHISR